MCDLYSITINQTAIIALFGVLSAMTTACGGLSYRAAAAEQPELKLRRFGEGFAVVPELPAGSAQVAIPADRSDRPWQAELVTGSRLELCP